MGLGRAQLEQSIVEAETSTRRQLDVEQQMRETETQREQRMQRAGHREVVEKQVADMNRTFYCEVCIPVQPHAFPPVLLNPLTSLTGAASVGGTPVLESRP